MSKIDLFCIPYAGGSAYTIYSKWHKKLNSKIRVQPLELAGHGSRMSEPFYDDVQNAVDDLMEKIKNHIRNRPYAIYGHSMGTLLAYELTVAVKVAGLPQPRALFLSGRQPPHHDYEGKKMYKMSDEEFLKNIKDIGGTPPLLFESSELVKVFLPILRNDYRLIEQYSLPQHIIKIDSDFVFFYSYNDNHVTESGILEWKRYSNKSFEHYNFTGGHFFINEQWEQICMIINQNLI